MPLIQSIDRALRILDLFDEYTTELKITEISNRMNLNKSTVHALLKTLQHHNYIEQDSETGKYKLGLKLFERGNLVVNRLDIRSIAKKYLLELSRKTGHTIHLVILDGKEGLYIDKVEGTSAIVVYSRIGRRIPIHSSAVGKALVAFKSEHELNKILDGYIYKQQTEKTITSEQDFLKELSIVRERGYAIDNEENEPGISCIAIPIRNHLGEVAAAISLSMPAAKLTEGQIDHMIPMIKEVGDHISSKMGYNPNLIIK
ncbi:IclR family transcriptional regulator [Heyndrickxia ginsengihumi]|uniref:Glycerol operon regulatory protein n=1 Tax=Heyndrickxia ginsengihumi TaxID=363870 RepID=A0A0A6XY49_9BACI|nr:IclR family transcriptional regulator [Heyndrickxia ginsengihumi]KHD85067.1 IclR family transcriptional regulator [Heyndrickxia ginsengihumi]MBE6183324.1 IclR family transcriptional regulator [Bacillus sp. (in: firmicutes)]MCM3024114.1 IclR family transcriptional regulator [Heyndrickxia ginsengihumi]NEY21045.1 IclR family transcriptional regulator [Heyndrickxia ginsengihumi]